MTAILAIENCEMDDVATASEFAVKSIPYDYSIANIYVGEQVTIKDLLYVLMLHSANEAAYVLAEHIGGSVEGFAEMMNDKAKEIGCQNTHFVNPNGIQDENHYSTAYDLALIAKYAMQNETFREIVKTTSYTMQGNDLYPYGTRAFNNTNHLIMPSTDTVPNKYYYPYAIGIKTGYTSAAQNCLVSAANKNDTEYICVVLGATAGFENGASVSYRYTDSIELFNFAFENFKLKQVGLGGELLESVNADFLPEEMDVALIEDLSILESKDQYKRDIVPTIVLNENLSLPIEKGDVVGIAEYALDNDTYSVEIVSMEDIEQPILEKITDSFEDFTAYYVIAGSLLAIGIIGLVTSLTIPVLKKKKFSKEETAFLEEDQIIKPKEPAPPKTEIKKEIEKTEEPEEDLEGELNSKVFKKR